jgi:N-acetylmuramoyl-L-alanine amidase
LPDNPFRFFSSARRNVLDKRIIRFFMIAVVFLLSMSQPCPAATIILDPGHGGDDSGALNGNAYSEKQFSLALAQKISDLLAPRHRVEMTRSSDVAVSPMDRAALANHLKADLMISLHAAVAPYCSDRQAAIYFHNDGRLVFPPGMPTQGKAAESETDRPDWIKLQTRHQHQSQHLASLIKQSLLERGAFDHITISGVPLVALMGADLPAVLIEVGCMHPFAAIPVPMAEQQISKYAQSIADAVDWAVSGLLQP